MLPVHPVTVPTPFPVGAVNAYLIPLDPVTLIDCGMPSQEEKLGPLQEALKANGLRWTDLKRVLITHAHPDHMASAELIRRISGCTIYLHEWEKPKLDYDRHFVSGRRAVMLQAGVPPHQVTESLDPISATRNYLQRPEEVTFLRGGETFAFTRGSLAALHMPGHSLGQLNYWDEDSGTLFAGDNLLEQITPNPVVEMDPVEPLRRVHSLQQYLQTLQKLVSLPVRRIFPGHGAPFGAITARVEEILHHHRQRLAQVESLLAQSGGGTTAYELACGIYPRLRGLDVFLAISEVLGHLDLLEEEGRLVVEDREGIHRYRLLEAL